MTWQRFCALAHIARGDCYGRLAFLSKNQFRNCFSILGKSSAASCKPRKVIFQWRPAYAVDILAAKEVDRSTWARRSLLLRPEKQPPGSSGACCRESLINSLSPRRACARSRARPKKAIDAPRSQTRSVCQLPKTRRPHAAFLLKLFQAAKAHGIFTHGQKIIRLSIVFKHDAALLVNPKTGKGECVRKLSLSTSVK